MKKLYLLAMVLAITLCTASRARAYDTAGSMVKVATVRGNQRNLTQLTWTAQIFEYTYNSSTQGTLRIEFNSVGFMGSGGIAYIGAMIQNVGHSFPDDASVSIGAFPALGLYLTSLQSDLPDSKYGLEILVNPNQAPQFGRCFQNIDGTGFSGKNIYTRQNIGTPSEANPIIVTWTVTKGETVVNPQGNLSKNIQGEWVPLVGTFVKWNFKIELNGVAYNVANFYLPIERAEYLSTTDPLVFHQEYFGSASQKLNGDKTTVRYINMRTYDGSNWHDLEDRKIVWRIDDEAGNHDSRFGWKSDGISMTSRAGHEEDANECFRDVGKLFPLFAQQSFYVEGGNGNLNVGVPSGYHWTAVAGDPNWVGITSGSNQNGSGTVSFIVAPNLSASARSSILTIAGETIGIQQKGQFIQSLQPRDFDSGDWLFEDYGGQGSTTAMSFTGIQSFNNGSVTNSGPVFSSVSNFGYVMLDQTRNLLLLHPIAGSFNPRRGTVASFTAPQSGTYTITGAFARANNALAAGDGVSVSIFKGFDSPNSLFASTISSNNAVNVDSPFSGTGVTNFNLNVPLSQGEVMRFVVFSGPQQDASFDLTALQVSLRRDNAIQPDFTISTDSAAQSISPGATAHFAVSVQALNGFNQPVNLSATLLPPDSTVNGEFSANSIAPGASSTFTVHTQPNTQPSTLTVEIAGTASGLAHKATVTVTVTLAGGPSISSAVFDGTKKLTISGSNFGSAPRVFIKDVERTDFVASATDVSIQLKGKAKKLGLKSGDNTIQVLDSSGTPSNTFVLKL